MRHADTVTLRWTVCNPSLLGANDTIPIADLDTAAYTGNITILSCGWLATSITTDTVAILFDDAKAMSSGTLIDSLFIGSAASGQDGTPTNATVTPEDVIFMEYKGTPGSTNCVHFYLVYVKQSKAD